MRHFLPAVAVLAQEETALSGRPLLEYNYRYDVLTLLKLHTDLNGEHIRAGGHVGRYVPDDAYQ